MAQTVGEIQQAIALINARYELKRQVLEHEKALRRKAKLETRLNGRAEIHVYEDQQTGIDEDTGEPVIESVLVRTKPAIEAMEDGPESVIGSDGLPTLTERGRVVQEIEDCDAVLASASAETLQWVSAREAA